MIIERMMHMKKSIEEVKCSKLDHFGRGIAKVNNKVMFVHGLLPKESADVTVIRENSKYIEAEVSEFASKSLSRQDPPCPYYGICGGCQLMHMAESLQKEFKESKVKDLLAKFANYHGPIEEMLTGPSYEYRNKITFHVKNKKMGLYEALSNDIVEIDSCLLLNPVLNQVIPILKEYFHTHETNITKVVLRHTDQGILLGTDHKEELSTLPLPEGVELCDLEEKTNHTITIGTFQFHASIASFFQINEKMIPMLYQQVIDTCKKEKPDKVLDLYCGTGTIGIMVSPYAKEVLGIELCKEAVEDARRNAQLNHIDNISFIEGKVEENLENLKDADLVILDPPRAGIMRQGIDDLLKIGAKTLVYVSCDPATLARDISLLSSKYEIEKVTPVDMFPNTYHVECVCVLKRKDR